MNWLLAALVGVLVAAAPAIGSARPATSDEIVARATALGVGPQAAALSSRFLPGSRLVRGGRATVGGDRLGGRPDLPRGMAWPRCHGRPLTFLLQADMRSVPGVPDRARGTLFVFADTHEDSSGIAALEEVYGSVRPGGCVAVRHTTTTALHRRPAPRGARALRSTPLQQRSVLTVPTWEAAEAMPGISFSDAEADAWFTLEDEAGWSALGQRTPYDPIHQVLGWSSPVQGPTELNCRGSARHPRRLLAQIDWDTKAGFAIGDGGALYVTISAGDLSAGRFDRLCAEFQEA